jgi:hypothetical protein
MSTLRVNTIQTNTTSGIDVNSPLETVPSLDVTGSVTVGSNISVSGIVTAGTFSGNLTGNVTSSGVTTVAAGSTAAPSISPSGDSNTGIFFPSADTIAFGEGGVEGFRLDSSGNISIANGNLVFSTSGKGIDFSATANSSGTMTSELLSDYEEGTWTPTWDTAENNWSGTYNDQSGFYTKIGRQVTLGFRLVGTRNAGTGSLQISGLPFNASSSDRFVFNVSPTFGGTWGSTNAPCAGFIFPTTRILLKKPDGSDSRVQADTNVDAALVGSSFGLIGTITYFTS